MPAGMRAASVPAGTRATLAPAAAAGGRQRAIEKFQFLFELLGIGHVAADHDRQTGVPTYLFGQQ